MTVGGRGLTGQRGQQEHIGQNQGDRSAECLHQTAQGSPPVGVEALVPSSAFAGTDRMFDPGQSPGWSIIAF